MFIKDLGEIKAVCFDIDGTLYRSIRLNFKMIPHVIFHSKIFIAYGKTRKIMHSMQKVDDFSKVQAEKMAEFLKCSPENAQKILDKVIYKGMEKYFVKMKTCKDSIELIKDLKKQGFKIALLSDFPPEQKGEIWGIKNICDVILGTEQIGALKPSTMPFHIMAEKLGISEEEILYVGNSHQYDIIGAKNANMKTAWLLYPIQSFFGKKSKIADINFCHFKQLRKILLENTNN